MPQRQYLQHLKRHTATQQLSLRVRRLVCDQLTSLRTKAFELRRQLISIGLGLPDHWERQEEAGRHGAKSYL
eukprot:scaffold46618_cov17-Prasinocladus_malaysianus.AAC.1